LLIVKGEQPIHLVGSSETWGMEKRGWKKVPICLTANGIFVATHLGFLYAVDEPPLKPGMVNFGINVSCIPPEVIKSTILLEKGAGGNSLPFLRMEIGRNLASLYFDIPFSGECSKAAGGLVRYLNESGSTRNSPNPGRCMVEMA